MRNMLSFYLQLLAGLAAVLLFLWVVLRPDVTTVQRGYRGVGMEHGVTQEKVDQLLAESVVPEPYAEVPDVGPRAGVIYENVEVLGHLSVGGFGRLMNAISDWVVSDAWLASEEARWRKKGKADGLKGDELANYVSNKAQKCNYCHNPNNMASDEVYTKVVSRRMIQMTQHVNSKWQTHVASTGVTCYTCHRGQEVPQYLWFEAEPGPNEFEGGLGTRGGGQNLGAESVAYASLPYDPFTPFLLEDHADNNGIRVVGPTPLPTGNLKSTKQAEWTYGLMMHMSEALGVNCTYCHNSRSMAMWNQSPPARATAWYGIRMTRNLNQEYLNPLKPVYPAHRLGPTGDAPKANCYTCHYGAYKPLLGARMLDAYPSLAAPAPQPEVSLNLE